MAAVVKTVRTLRNNWKKTVFFTGLGIYGVHYGRTKYEESLIRREYCMKAKEYGHSPVKTGEKIRKITVFLNPAASHGKGRKIFEKNAAPMLYLAGIEVNVVKTEYEGQAKKYMEVLEKTDAIIVAGGDGTLSEIVTGLLRRPDHETMSKIPIGVIPVGKTNTLAMALYERRESDVRWLAEAAMAVIEGSTRPVDVLHIKGGEESKSVYAVSGMDWGAYRNSENRKVKYWYFGPLKHRLTYIVSALKTWPPLIQAKLSFIQPCEGCSKCYTPPQAPPWRWWHFLLAPAKQAPVKDYSKITNEECGNEHCQDMTAIEFMATTANQGLPHQDKGAINISIGPDSILRTDFIKEGWRRMQGGEHTAHNKEIKARSFTLIPKTLEDGAAWFDIDSEQFEVMPIEVELLKNKLQVFCSQQMAQTGAS